MGAGPEMAGIHFKGACTGMVCLLGIEVRDWLKKHWVLLYTALWVEGGTRAQVQWLPSYQAPKPCSELRKGPLVIGLRLASLLKW